MNLRIETQPYNGTANSYLSPALVAKVSGNVGHDCSASATLVDTAGNAVTGVIGGKYNTSGRSNRSGTEVTFKWSQLSLNREGTYQLRITILVYAPALGSYLQAASALTDPITIAA
jgi:hypothetical protein